MEGTFLLPNPEPETHYWLCLEAPFVLGPGRGPGQRTRRIDEGRVWLRCLRVTPTELYYSLGWASVPERLRPTLWAGGAAIG